MTRWVLGSVIGALAVAPLGFAGVTQGVLAGVARAVFAVLLLSGCCFLGLAAVWGRRWAI